MVGTVRPSSDKRDVIQNTSEDVDAIERYLVSVEEWETPVYFSEDQTMGGDLDTRCKPQLMCSHLCFQLNMHHWMREEMVCSWHQNKYHEGWFQRDRKGTFNGYPMFMC